MLRGKQVKTYTVQPVSQDFEETNAAAKLRFATSIFQRFSADPTVPASGVDGVVAVFDSADGGIIGAMRSNLEPMARGSLSPDNFWRQCYLEPPDALQSSPKP
jgi:hypothetical protein